MDADRQARSAAQAQEFAVGDRVRFNRFGEWLDGVVILIRRDLLCIQYGTHEAVTWRYPAWHKVVKA